MYNSSPGNNYYYQVDFPASHGDGVDIAAPCVDVLTTDLLSTNGFSATDYTFFNGTSAACPMAAGVASLIFSVNPLLDWERARKCLETTCDKVGGYTYNSGVSGQPNGTWSFELGYGRINANSAVQAALTATFPLTTVVNSVRNKWATGTYTVDANDAITIEAIIFDNYFTMTTANWYRNGSLIANNTKTISADKLSYGFFYPIKLMVKTLSGLILI
jgi:subtilisin family serine protease